MSRADGYEELPGGDADAPQQQPAPPLQPPGPTFTQPPAGVGQQPQPPPVMGVPAYPQRQQQEQQQRRLDQLPPLPQHLAELPSAMEEWDAAAVIMSVWLGCSVATLAIGVLSLGILAVAAGVCGTVGASTHRCASCRAAVPDLGAAVRRIHLLALMAASISGFVGALGLLVSFGLSATCASSDHPKHCAELTEVTLLFGLWYSAYAGVSAAVVRRSGRMRRLLNPVSSGFVNIQSV